MFVRESFVCFQFESEKSKNSGRKAVFAEKDVVLAQKRCFEWDFLSSLRFVSRAGSDLASVCWTLRKSVDVVEFAGVGYLRCKQLANLEWTQAHLCDSVS